MKNRSLVSLIYVLFAVLNINISSCSSGQKQGNVIKLSNIDYTDWNKIMNFTEAIPLDNDSCVLVAATTCCINNNGIYFCDQKTNKIYLFDKKGKLVNTIGEVGKSNSEYIDIRDMQLSPDNSLVCVLEPRGVVCYDAKNGKFVKRPYRVSDNNLISSKFMPMENDEFLFYNYNNTEKRISYYSNKGNVGILEGKCRGFDSNRFYKYHDKYRVLSDFGEFYIDEFKNGKLTRLYTFDLGDKALPETMFPQDARSFHLVFDMPEYCKFISAVYETSKWLYCQLGGLENSYYNVFINKTDDSYYAGPSDTSMGMVVVDADDKYFYALVYPDYVQEKSFMDKLLRSKGLSLQGNPILVKFNINETL